MKKIKQKRLRMQKYQEQIVLGQKTIEKKILSPSNRIIYVYIDLFETITSFCKLYLAYFSQNFNTWVFLL